MENKIAVDKLTNGIFIVMFTMSICNTIQGALLTDLIDHYQLKSAMQGMFGAFQSVGSLLSLGLVLFMVGRVHKPTIIIVLCVLIAISMLGAAMQPSFYLLVIFYMVFGIGKGLMDTTATSMIADLHDGRNAAKKMGILHGVFGFGGLMSPIIIVQLKRIGLKWNEVYLVFAVIAVICLAIYLFRYIRTRKQLNPYFDKNKAVSFGAIKSYVIQKKNYLLMCATFCYAFFIIGYYLWINRYVEFFLGNAAMGALALALFWIGTALARIFLPRLRYSAVKILIWGNCATMVLSLIGVWSMSVTVIVICSLFVGFASGATVSLLLYMGCSWLRENTSLVTTLFYFVFFISQIICPLAVGVVMEYAGMPLGMTIAVVSAFFSALFLFPLRNEAV